MRNVNTAASIRPDGPAPNNATTSRQRTLWRLAWHTERRVAVLAERGDDLTRRYGR